MLFEFSGCFKEFNAPDNHRAVGRVLPIRVCVESPVPAAVHELHPSLKHFIY